MPVIPGPRRATHRRARWAIVLLLSIAPALAAPPRVPKRAPAPKPSAEEALPGPEWRVDELTVLDDGPVTPTASVANAEGFVFAVYGKPNTFVKFRLEIPAPGLGLVADRPLTMQVDTRTPHAVMRDDVMSDVLGRQKLRLDPRWVEWEFGPPYRLTQVALVLYQMRTGKVLHVVLALADGTTRTTDFSLRGARDRLAVVAPVFDAAYARENREFEAGMTIEYGVLEALHAGETRCGFRAGDKGPPCAQRLRDCILAYPEPKLPPARAKLLTACLDAVRR